MNEHAIRVSGLGKSYTITHRDQQAANTFREAMIKGGGELAGHLRALLGGRRPWAAETREQFWALDDVSFDIAHGDTVGIIGRNGAGKSTLLKLLSRITEPSTGRIEIQGRVASLLEVGTGFHPELSGRENIFLNGAILGMSRAEIRAKFDEIVAFAEVERFLDTPVKRYSSGMYVRLAFAVAAHLDPEILIVDEVLAVGDAKFQEKCLGRMGDLSSSGKTVLFVSHNISAVNRLCRKAIYLRDGHLVEFGAVGDVVAAYMHGGGAGLSRLTLPVDEALVSSGGVALSSMVVKSREVEDGAVMRDDEAVEIYIEIDVGVTCEELSLGCLIRASSGEVIIHSQSNVDGGNRLLPGRNVVVMRVPANTFRAGRYYVSVLAHVPNVVMHFHHEDAVCFDVITESYHITRHAESAWLGALSPAYPEWTTR